MDLSFDPDLSMFVEERKFLFFLFLVVFSVFVYSFYFVVSKLVDVTLMENGLVKVDGEFFERKDVRFNCEIIIFNLSVASINVGENKKYFVPKGAFSKIPMMIVKKAKNKRIKIFEEFVVEK
ncbi:hypothetical protein GCM10009347_40760 [Shewanella algicola]|uniref:Uncharacterized protein n=1 Tax=Shewanella algicola TaxID=640633 RepID=A0A9X1Z8C4_9GAMM|nr:hypothetical protein [Shewanella algicola]MCL1107673.1 hypothetical protein [Shewanella algicola]GGP71727.1 hypothetical protein GCM10009347_40760 [Shewanella algicola]